MSACLEEGDVEQAERANWMIEVEKLRKVKIGPGTGKKRLGIHPVQ